MNIDNILKKMRLLKDVSKRYKLMNQQIDDSIAILRGLKDSFERHHGVKINDSAIIGAVNLSQRYITDRFSPDKSN